MLIRHLSETLRAICRRPAPAIAAIVVLTLALALFTAITSVLQAFLFRPSMVHDIDRVVRVRERISTGAELATLNVSPQMYDAWRRGQSVFTDMAAATSREVSIRDGSTDALSAGIVTANFFAVLGVTPQIGRDFARGEDVSGHDDVVLLSDATWHARYGADPKVIGRQVRIDGRPHTVIGVMPPNLSHPYGADVWLPMRWDEVVREVHGHYLYVPARLREGVDVATAQSRLSMLTAALHKAQPELGQADAAKLAPIREEALGNLRPILWLLFACAAFVLLVATLNTATLFYAKRVADERATMLHIALGATRTALFWRAFVRSGFVIGVSTVLALGIAPWIYTRLPGLSGDSSIKEFDSVARLDPPTLAWIVGIAIATALALAVIDTRRSMRVTFAHGSAARGATIGRSARSRLWIATVAQCALSFSVAAASLLVTFSYQHLISANRGFNGNHLVVADISFPTSRYANVDARNALLGRLLESLRALPGVQAASASTVTPDYRGDWAASFVIPGRAPLPDPGYEATNHRLVAPDYFSTMGIPLLAGRDFDAADPARDLDAIVVSRSFAEHAWPNESAIGKRVNRLDSRKRVTATLHVIGVAGDVVETVREPYAPARRSWYLSTAAGSNYDYAAISVVVRGSNAGQIATGMRRTMMQLDPELAWSHLAPMRQRLAESLDREQLSSFLFLLFATCSIAIALGGLYGALAFAVETDRREFGIKLALGAQPRQVFGGVLVRSLRLATSGVALGLALTLPLISLVGAYVYGASLRDAWSLLPLAAMVLTLAFLTGLVPARRAARVAPVEALRCE